MGQPERHGIFQVPGDPPVFWQGIYNAFDAAMGMTPSPQLSPGQLSMHFHATSEKLLYSLDILQQQLTSLELQQNEPGVPLHEQFPKATRMQLTVAVETVLQYLGIWLDDVGRCVAICTGLAGKSYDKWDGLKRLMTLAEGRPLGHLSAVLSDVETSTWWKIGFWRGHGLRQRFVHYPDLLRLQSTKAHGEDRYRVVVTLCNIGKPDIDVVDRLHDLLLDLCLWLDRLESALLEVIATRFPRWTRPERCPSVLLPVGCSLSRSIPTGFLYLPLCAGSAALVKSVEYPKTGIIVGR